jgi:RNA polymerase sigma factor (sigma-70 family)
MEKLDDNDLMLAIRGGNRMALGILYKRYYDDIFAYVFQLTRDREQSRDLVQSIFMRIYKYRQSYQRKSSFRAWVFTLSRNHVYDHIKNNRTINTIPLDEMPHFEPVATQDNKEESLKIIDKALARLALEDREILTMSRYRGLKYKEIAKIQNITEANVKVKVFRALQKLRITYLDILEEDL